MLDATGHQSLIPRAARASKGHTSNPPLMDTSKPSRPAPSVASKPPLPSRAPPPVTKIKPPPSNRNERRERRRARDPAAVNRNGQPK